jgi:hypothetical protein
MEVVDGVPVARLTHAHTVFDRAVEQLAAVIRQAVADGHPQLLLDVVEIGFEAPTLADRLRMVRLWAEAADGRLRIAMVARPEFIDAERFGVVAAGKFGLAGQVFASRDEALAWLREEREAELRWRNGPSPDA